MAENGENKTSNQSEVMGVSVRGWLAVTMTLTVCFLSAFRIEVKEPLYSLVLLSCGFYFGQAKK